MLMFPPSRSIRRQSEAYDCPISSRSVEIAQSKTCAKQARGHSPLVHTQTTQDARGGYLTASLCASVGIASVLVNGGALDDVPHPWEGSFPNTERERWRRFHSSDLA